MVCIFKCACVSLIFELSVCLIYLSLMMDIKRQFFKYRLLDETPFMLLTRKTPFAHRLSHTPYQICSYKLIYRLSRQDL